ncbi:MAG TPA: hypothetical protein VIK44_05080 [Acetobacterium sp.]
MGKRPTENNKTCPICHIQGESVGKVTVEHLVTDPNRVAVVGDHYRICINV